MKKVMQVNVDKRDQQYSIHLCNDLITNFSNYNNHFSLNAKALIITTPTVYKLYKDFIDKIAFNYKYSKIEILNITEDTKTLDQVSYICSIANSEKFGKEDSFVTICGGCCQDVVTTAAALYKRGMKVIRIPTTLIGAIDAGVGIKSSINLGQQKSAVGLFHPPSHVLIDLNFIKSLPTQHILSGIAEIFKIALILDNSLFDLLEQNALKAQENLFYCGKNLETEAIIYKAIYGMIMQLTQNFYEDKTYERLVDFGHTFSNTIESESNWTVPHGIAVGIDMALSSYISFEMGSITFSQLQRILQLMKDLSLPIWNEFLTFDTCSKALQKACLHRGSSLNLVIPNDIGAGYFIKEITNDLKSIIKKGIQFLKSLQLPNRNFHIEKERILGSY